MLDEPSIGLHQRDNDRLINTLKEMRDLGNTLIVVEHDDDTMRAADYLIDVGPGAGEHGGEIVASGTPKQVMRKKSSLTGQYLSGQKLIEVPEHRREITDRKLHIKGARSNNLKDVNVDLPLSTMTVVTGVSGSGKSSLVNEVLYKTLSKEINNSKVKPGDNDGIDGLDRLDKVIDIDQSQSDVLRALTQRLIRVCSMIYVTSSLKQMKRRSEAILKAVSASTLKVDVVKHVKVTESSRLKCTSYRMCMYLVKFVMVNAIIAKH